MQEVICWSRFKKQLEKIFISLEVKVILYGFCINEQKIKCGNEG